MRTCLVTFATFALLALAAASARAQAPLVGYERGCAAGDLIDCTVLALIHQTGAAGERDLPQAMRLYERACSREVPAACRRLELLDQDVTIPDDERVRVGYVADAHDGAPLGGAILRVRGAPGVGQRRYVADEAGRVILEPLPRGAHPIEVVRGGYVTVPGRVPVPWDGDFLVLMERVSETEEASTGQVFGRVVEEGGEAGISDVDVIVSGAGSARTISNGDGRFLLADLPPGDFEIRFERLGYEPRVAAITVERGRTAEVYATLAAEPIELAPVEVTVTSRYLQRSGFYRRAASTSGDRFTYRDIERLNASFVGDIVRRVGGVTVVSSQIGTGSEAISNTRLSGAPFGRCRLRPYYNGVPLVDFNLELLAPEDIEGMEVYQGSNVPVEFLDQMQHAGPSCGVILIWTRDPRRPMTPR